MSTVCRAAASQEKCRPDASMRPYHPGQVISGSRDFGPALRYELAAGKIVPDEPEAGECSSVPADSSSRTCRWCDLPIRFCESLFAARNEWAANDRENVTARGRVATSGLYFVVCGP